jgi:hypothetical protein
VQKFIKSYYLRKTLGQGKGISVAGNNERHKKPEPVFISLVKILRYPERKTVFKKIFTI